jgi:hypothetical protein
VCDARTLAQLAEVYERPLAELERANPDDDGTQEWVNIPDPDFAPLLAAHLAAQALATSGLSAAKRAELMQLLVPAAIPNPTALDTVLARPVLATRPKTPATLDEWTAVVKSYQEGG